MQAPQTLTRAPAGLDPSRLNRQRLFGLRWLQAGMKGTLEAVTGFGKSVAALEAIDMALASHEGPLPATIKVVVPTRYLKAQWEGHLQRRGYPDAEVWIINSLVKQEEIDCDILVLDEIHVYTAPVFSQVFRVVRYRSVLGLTATMKDDQEKNALIERYAPVVDRVTLQEAHQQGWVSDFIIYNLEVPLTAGEEQVYRRLHERFNRFFAVFGHDFQLAMRCVTSPAYAARYADEINDEPRQVRNKAMMWMRNMQARKKMLYDLPAKVEVARRIIEQHPDRLVVVFSQTVEQANRLAKLLGPIATTYHSKAKKGGVDLFTEQENPVRVLCTARAFDQGADIPAIDMAIILSGSSKALQGLQRYGRALRARKGKRAVIVELFVPDTQDERWLRDRQRKTPRHLIKRIQSVEEIE